MRTGTQRKMSHLLTTQNQSEYSFAPYNWNESGQTTCDLENPVDSTFSKQEDTSKFQKWSPRSLCLDYIKGDHPTVAEAVNSINTLLSIRDHTMDNESILINARFTPAQCKELLNKFPQFKRCFQESGDLVMLDC